MIVLEKAAKEGGTYGVNLSFFNETGAATSPVTASWSLIDLSGNTINSRTDVSISSPGETETVVLYGDDLVAQGANSASILTVATTFSLQIQDAFLEYPDEWLPPIFS